MLAVLTATLLGIALILALLSPENALTVLVGGLGAMVLAPVTLLVVVVFLTLSIVGSTPVLGGLESTLEGLLTGAHGFGWEYYAALCVPLWLGVVFQIGEATEQKEDDSRAEEQTTDEATEDSKIETEELVELDSVDEQTAEGLREAGFDSVEHVAAASLGQLQTVECVSTTLAAQIATETGDVEVSNRVDATVAELGADDGTESDETAETTCDDEDDGGDGETELTDISGVSEGRADALREAGYDSVDDIRGASTEELANVVGMALAARIKADVDDSDSDETVETITDDSDDEVAETTTDDSDDEDRTVEIAELTDISGVTEPSAHALREAGYNSAEDVRSASKDELANVDGVSTAMAAAIHSDNGDSDSDATLNSRTTNEEAEAEQTEAERSSHDHGAAPVTDQQTETTGSASVSDESEADSGHDERSVEGLRDAVESLWEQATTDPLVDPDTTRADLIQVHTRAVELAERAAEHDRPEPLGFAQETLDRAEQRLDALAEIVDTLDAARERVPPERGPSAAIRTQSLQRAREYYDTAIQTAQQAGFSTTRVERERDQIRTELAGREVATTAPPSRFESESEPDPNSDTDVDPDTASASASVSESADESTADSGFQFGAAAESNSVSSPASDTGDESGGESADASGEGPSPTTSTDAGGDQENSATPDTTQPTEPAKADYVKAIQRVADASDRVVRSTDVSEQSPYSVTEMINAFGSWQDALEAAGVDNETRLIDELRRVADEVGGRPTTAEVNEYAHVSATMYANYFGSYTNAVERASVDDEQENTTAPDMEPSNEPTRADYIEAIQQVADASDQVVKSTDVSEQNPYSVNEIVSAFGSWREALEAAGVDNETRLLDELRRVADELGRQPTTTDVNEHAHVSATLYADYFGTYTDAVERALSEDSTNSESETEQEDATRSADDVPSSRQALLDEIQRLDKSTDGYPMTTEMRTSGAYNPGAYYDEFESWEEALEAAGIDKRQRLVEDIRRVAERVDGVPSTLDVDEHGTHSSGTHSKYFGGWDKALDAVGLSEKTGASDRQSLGNSASHAMTGFVTGSTSDRTSSADGDGQPSAFVRITEITEDGRLDRPIALNVRDTSEISGSRKQAYLFVDDLDGNQCQMNLWQTHSDNVTWEIEIGHWYVLSEARGKVWTNDGETNRRLSSTSALRVEHVGTDPPVEGSEPASRSESGGSTGPDTVETADAGGPADETESHGILDDVTSEFDNLPGTEES